MYRGESSDVHPDASKRSGQNSDSCVDEVTPVAQCCKRERAVVCFGFSSNFGYPGVWVYRTQVMPILPTIEQTGRAHGRAFFCGMRDCLVSFTSPNTRHPVDLSIPMSAAKSQRRVRQTESWPTRGTMGNIHIQDQVEYRMSI
jgi:hypothetical protein